MKYLEYPRHVYKSPGPFFMGDGKGGVTYDCKTVDNEEDHEKALADGWHMSRVGAVEAVEQVSQEPKSADIPERAELEKEANKLGIKFDGRTPDRKLARLILEKYESN